MSTESTTSVNESSTATAAAPKKKVTKKKAAAPKKKAAKKGAKKSVKKGKKVTKATNGKPRAKKEGLRKPQVRVLQALSKSSRAMNRNEISDKGGVDLAMLNSYIGSHDLKVRAKNDKNMPCLLTLGFVKEAPAEEEGRGVYYTITAAGKKALASSKE